MIRSCAAWELLVASAVRVLLSKRWCWVFLLWLSCRKYLLSYKKSEHSLSKSFRNRSNQHTSISRGWKITLNISVFIQGRLFLNFPRLAGFHFHWLQPQTAPSGIRAGQMLSSLGKLFLIWNKCSASPVLITSVLLQNTIGEEKTRKNSLSNASK